MAVDVAIVGAGVSGLATAWELRQRGHSVLVLERLARTGGNAQSERIGGFLMEHGPSSICPLPADVLDLSRDLGLEKHRVGLGDAVRYRYLTKGAALRPIAKGPTGLLTAPYLSLGGRLRMLTEPSIPRGAADPEESVAEFFRRRFGREFAERIIDPLVGGLYAARAEDLEMAAVFPRLAAMERRFGSVTVGSLQARIAGGRMPGSQLFSWRQGIGTLPSTLTRHLDQCLVTQIAVRSIVKQSGGFLIGAGRAGSFRARSVVLATQPHVAASLTEPLSESLTEALTAIPSPPISVVFLGFRRKQVAHALDGLGYLTPSNESRQVSGALFCSTMFSGRAPEGHVAFSVYIGGWRARHSACLPPDDLVALACWDLRDLLGARGAPVVARVRHWSRGLPQMTRGHAARIAAISKAHDEIPGLFLTGNYFEGPGVAACVARAKKTAGQVSEFLGRQRLKIFDQPGADVASTRAMSPAG